jgi:hypothetical protein
VWHAIPAKEAGDSCLMAAESKRITAAPEVSTEQRQQEMARLNEPDPDELGDRVRRVMKTIMRHAKGLNARDTKRFFALLRDEFEQIEDDIDEVVRLYREAFPAAAPA